MYVTKTNMEPANMFEEAYDERKLCVMHACQADVKKQRFMEGSCVTWRAPRMHTKLCRVGGRTTPHWLEPVSLHIQFVSILHKKLQASVPRDRTEILRFYSCRCSELCFWRWFPLPPPKSSCILCPKSRARPKNLRTAVHMRQAKRCGSSEVCLPRWGHSFWNWPRQQTQNTKPKHSFIGRTKVDSVSTHSSHRLISSTSRHREQYFLTKPKVISTECSTQTVLLSQITWILSCFVSQNDLPSFAMESSNRGMKRWRVAWVIGIQKCLRLPLPKQSTRRNSQSDRNLISADHDVSCFITLGRDFFFDKLIGNAQKVKYYEGGPGICGFCPGKKDFLRSKCGAEFIGQRTNVKACKED